MFLEICPVKDEDKKCYTCKHTECNSFGWHLCSEDVMSPDGYYDYEYYGVSSDSICPKWEWNGKKY